MNALKEGFQRAVACATNEVLILSSGAYRPGDETHSLRFARGTVRLASADAISLALEYQFRIERSAADSNMWEARQVGYYYYFDDLQGREIIAYHWHPHVEGMTYPHLHISSGAVRSDVIERAGPLHGGERIAHRPRRGTSARRADRAGERALARDRAVRRGAAAKRLASPAAGAGLNRLRVQRR